MNTLRKLTITSLFLLSTLAHGAGTTTAHLSDSRPSGTASSGNFGLGVMLGDPTGASLKYWLTKNSALDFGLAYSFGDYVAVIADYLWHFSNAFSGQTGSQFVPYVGVGGELFLNSGDTWVYDRFGNRVYAYHGYGNASAAFGVRIPVGLEFLPHKAPLGIFAELVPGVGFIPGAFGFFQGDVGIRFYL